MANKPTSSKRKKPVSQKRVAVVLTSLVATLTVSAGLLLALEGLPITNAGPTMSAPTADLVTTDVELRHEPWDYIIVYESGAGAAKAADLAEGRFSGGPGTNSAARPGANFHFVVDSASGADGELVRGSAWVEQKPGAPNVNWPDARYYSNPYTNAVGICLVGDITKASQRQRDALSQLVRNLKDKLKIPAKQVLFQWELQLEGSRSTPTQKAFADKFRREL
jgi:hypothetical protein